MKITLDNTTFKHERLMQERKSRSDAINRALFGNNDEVETLKGRLFASMSLNVIFTVLAVLVSLVKSAQAWGV